MSDIVERLEAAASSDEFFHARQLKLEAAAEIARLRATEERLRTTNERSAAEIQRLSSENKRLRAALKPFADAYDAVGEWGPNNTSTARLTQLRSGVMVIDFINARRARDGGNRHGEKTRADELGHS